MSDKTLLSLKDIYVRFPLKRNFLGKARAYAHALNGVSLDIQRGETLGIVGESGCGKSTLAQVLMSLLPPTQGTMQWHKKETKPSIQIVFQDPQSSLDPRLPVWKVITEPLYVKGGMSAKALRQRAEELAQQVGIRTEYLERFPHEFSGGQRQRIAIARALAPKPDLIVLDEPTSALDISVQAQILNLLNELQKQLGLSYILISHNVSVVKYMSQRMGVMYLGQILELGKTQDIMASPSHPYTQLLLDAVPNLQSSLDLKDKLEAQDLPSNRNLPNGCYFYDRCSKRDTDKCMQPQALLAIPLQTGSAEEVVEPQRWVRCWRILEDRY
ncbi:MAG: ABC transporter ATP-binding protein [Pelistega sp.]|nr:ABC transporter ATP-binding protein [Pelistega sp.]